MAKAKLSIDNGRFDFKVEETIEHIMLNQNNIKKNANKFYEVKFEKSKSGEYRVYTRHGRVGEFGQENYRYFSRPVSEEEAKEGMMKLVNSKIKGGYEDVGVETETNPVTKVNLKGLPPLDKLIIQLYDETISTVRKNIETPLGNLSKEQIRKVRVILDKLYDAIKNKSPYSILEDLSSDLYTNLPQKSESRNVPLPVIDDFIKLTKQSDLLDAIESIVNVQSALDGTAKAKYEATGAKIELLPEDTDEWKRIVDYVNSTESNSHNARIHVQNIFTVEIKGEKERFNPKNIEVMELFHGTRSANILNIITQGLMVKPKTAVHTGSMFGNGIYFADQSTKSTQYSHKWADNKHDTSFLFLCDVAVGKIKEFEDAQPYLNKAPRGYQSVKGVKGRSLLHNEYIVYSPNQARVKYLIEFTVRRKFR